MKIGPEYIALDIEWNKKGQLLTIGEYDGELSPMANERNKQNLLNELINDPNARIVNHSIIGDCVQLVLNGYQLPETWVRGFKLWDTLIGARLYHEHYPSYGIEDLASHLCNIKPWKKETDDLFEKHGDYAEIPSDLRMARCRLDAYAARKLFEFLQPKVDNRLWAFNNVLASTLKRVELAGMKLDPTRLQPMSVDGLAFKQARALELENFAKEYGLEEFSATNDNHFRELLFDRLNVKPEPGHHTQTGLPAVDSDHLILLASKISRQDVQRAIDLRLKHERIDKLWSTYIGSFDGGKKGEPCGIFQYLTPNWFVYPTLNPVGAKTGRRACNSPNCQNQPSVIRKCFTSRFPNGKLIAFDHSQLEPRITAIIADIPEWLEVFEKKQNFYSYIAKKLWKQDVQKGEEKYTLTKSMVLALNYNMKRNLFKQRMLVDLGLELTDDEAQYLMDLYFKTVPQLPLHFLKRKEQILRDGYVENLVGHRYHLPCPDGDKSPTFNHNFNCAINEPIQGTASYVTGTGLIDVEVTLLKEIGISYTDHFNKLVYGYAKEKDLDYSEMPGILKDQPIDYPLIEMEVHDEILIDSPHEYVDRVIEIVPQVMANCTTLKAMFPEFQKANIPLVVEVSANSHWIK